MKITVEGTLARDAEARITSLGLWRVHYLIHGGAGVAFEVRESVGHDPAHGLAAERIARGHLRGSTLRAAGSVAFIRTDHDVPAVLLTADEILDRP